jgi:hypothetical protein
VTALTFLRGVARLSGQVLAARDVQCQGAREISMWQSRQGAERLTVAGPREDSHALPEAAGSNLVWGQSCLQPPAAQMQAELLPRVVSTRQAHATPPALAVAPIQPGAARGVSLAQPLLVSQPPYAVPERALLEPARPLLVWFRQGWAEQLRAEQGEELLAQSLERVELEPPAGVVEEPRQLVSCEPLWLRRLSRLCPKPLFPRQQIPPRRGRGNAGAPSLRRQHQSSSNASFSR